MSENKRFTLCWDNSISDNLEKKLYDLNSCKGRFYVKKKLNALWRQVQRFEKHNQRLSEENEQLKKENQELRQDNDIKFWKLQCIQSSNNNQIMLFELSRAIQQGYEVSDKFKQYLNEIKEHDKEIREKT